MVKILHTGDLHLDSAFSGLTGERAMQRRQGQRDLLRRIVELGNQEGVQILLLAGDLFDGKNAYSETAQAIADTLSRSTARVFISPGNHDPYGPSSPYQAVRMPENVHIFTSGRIECVEIPALCVKVYGAGFTGAVCEQSLLDGFQAPEDDAIRIGVLHGHVTEGLSVYNPVREQQIAESNLHYLALGHVHTMTEPRRLGITTYAYCGCPEGRGFDETGEKGVLMGTVSRDTAELDFVPVAGYRYQVEEILLNTERPVLEQVQTRVPERDAQLSLRIILNGSHDPIDMEELERPLAERYYQLSLQDRTVPVRPVWDGEEEDSLKGAFLRRLHERYRDTGDPELQRKLKLAARYGAAALENREEPR